jgi:pimeloyl-ACP methyl ester carboxylesterase
MRQERQRLIEKVVGRYFMVQPEVRILSDEGAGRAFVVVFDDDAYGPLVRSIGCTIAQSSRAVIVRISSVTAETWRMLAERFESMLSEIKVRQASFVGIAAGATIVQDLALMSPKLVRTLVIIDASLRPHPSRFERLLDRVEASLPFGLPLRLGSQGFNVRAYAHRLRCPMLLVSTSRASRFVSNELHALGRVAPTAWYVDIQKHGVVEEARELASYVLAFQDTPAKCPQKNLQEAV